MLPVRAYHERSKHHLTRYAAGPGRLDWDTQPDPLRHYAGAPPLELPVLADDLPACWDDLFVPGAVPEQALNLGTLAHLLQLALGLAAWKHYGTSRWSLRCNPSSGNLHPTEGYLINPDLPGLPAGVYHYQPSDHRGSRTESRSASDHERRGLETTYGRRRHAGGRGRARMRGYGLGG